MEPREMTVKEMANELFENNNPTILVFDENEDLTYIFEVLLNISIEALLKISNVEDYEHLDLTNIIILNRWLRKIGYNIKLKLDDYKNITNYSDRYCKIIIRTDKSNEEYFKILNIENMFHFLGNPNISKEFKYIEDIYAIIIQNEIIYKIYFTKII